MAADFAAPNATVSKAANWEGAYLGANIGYSAAHSDYTGGTIGDFDMSGGFVGGQVGYNFHLTDGVVLGVQADLDWANISGSDSGISDTINWMGSVTGHLGFALDNVMPYVLGGLAFADSTRTHTSPTTESNSQGHAGWTVGAGFQVMLADNISAFAEFRYSDFGARTYTFTGGGSNPEGALTDNFMTRSFARGGGRFEG